MKQVIRILISGILAGFIALGIAEIGVIGYLFPKGILSIAASEGIIFIIVFALIYFSVSIPIAKRLSLQIEAGLNKYPMQEILMYIIGLGIGLYVSNLICNILKVNKEGAISQIIVALITISLGYFGIHLVDLKKQEIKGWISKKGDSNYIGHPKILDTSVIIDGRILDIIHTGFIEGKIIVPTFVLDELRHISDSSDALKRARGRRGLDLLNELKTEEKVTVEVMDIDFAEIEEVDSKLLKLAAQINGKVITNDFNLNKVAKLQKVPVLNINELANAVKQVVLPNEEMLVTIVKEGKEQDQGLAYLNDGTMIVIENGKKYVGMTIKVVVSTVLQTSAGRMVFAKIVQ